MTPITDALITQIQTATHAHSNTVMRRMLGLPVRGKVAERVDEELRKVGLLPFEGPVDTQGVTP